MSTATSHSPTTQLDPSRPVGTPSIRPSGRQAVALAIATLVLLPLVSACGITSQTEPSSPPSHGHVTREDGGVVTHSAADESKTDEDDNESNEADENERDETEPGDRARARAHRDRHAGENENERDEKDNESDEADENERGD